MINMQALAKKLIENCNIIGMLNNENRNISLILHGYLDESFITTPQPEKHPHISSLPEGELEMKKLEELTWRIRSDGRYEIRFTNCNNRYSAYGKTLEECYRSYIKKVRNPEKNTRQRKKTITTLGATIDLVNWIYTWLREYKELELSESRLRVIMSTIRNHILPYSNKLQLQTLTAIDVKIILNQIKSGRMRIEAFDILNECLRVAQQNKLVTENVMQFLKRPTYVKKIGKPLTKNEESYILEKVKGSKYELPLKFLLGSGCHPQVLERLRWQDIDFDKKTIFVRETKTKYTTRYLPLFEHLEVIIAAVERIGDKVFDVSPKEMSKWFHKQLPNHSLRECRQTFATRLRECGVDMKVVQQWLGHSTYEQTANTYTHVLEEFENLQKDKLKDLW